MQQPTVRSFALQASKVRSLLQFYHETSKTTLATAETRASLFCCHIGLDSFAGNLLASCPPKTPKATPLRPPVFQISAQGGTASQMRLGSFGAYTLSYHHRGAPQTWTTVTPAHHSKLEELMHKASHGLHYEDASPTTAPSCAQFAQHKPRYIPTDSLRLRGIDFTTVVQQEGELVIVFPYAYHQTFNCGINITESVSYASERWTALHRKGLYKHCSTACPSGKPESLDLDSIINATYDPFAFEDSDIDAFNGPTTPGKRRRLRSDSDADSQGNPAERISPSVLRARRLRGDESNGDQAEKRIVLGQTSGGRNIFDMMARKTRGRIHGEDL